MIRLLSQAWVITVSTIQTVPKRMGASSVAIFGTACVVGVLVCILSMASGFEKAMVSAGSEDNAIVLRAAATSEMASGLSFEQTQIIGQAPGIKSENDQPLISSELYVVVSLPKKATGTDANVPLRGVGRKAFDVRENVRIIEGRSFEPGKNEIVVGRAALDQFEGLSIGQSVQFGTNAWTVVGVFEDNGSILETEIWCDVRILQQAYRRGNSFQSMRIKLADPETGIDQLEQTFASDPRVNVTIQPEKEFYADQSKNLSQFIKMIGYPLAVLMSIGAIFGAVNTMYASVSARNQEIATLRAIGFNGGPILISVLVESIILSLLGGAIGAVMVYWLFNGFTVSTINSASFSQVAFNFAVTGPLMLQGMIAAIVIGIVGGFFPAIKALRIPVANALRDS